jgi:predicted RNA-binding Zn-ribbon protein involved in translation (DUF1610 family)
MDSKLVKKWLAEGLKPSTFEFFTRRENVVIGKLPGKDAEVEYVCDKCGNYEIKTIEMEQGGKKKKKFERPEFSCTKCGKIFKVEPLKKLK